jgi:putative peptide zinc metalloprotease protein
VQRQSWRGQAWYLLCDDTSGRQHLINEAAYQFIGRCDGRHDVRAVWNAMLALRGDAAPSQPEVLQLLAQLDEFDLLQSERNANADTLFRRRDDRRQRRRRAMINPFAFRLSLGDPARLLHRFDPFARALFTPLMLWAWGGLVLLGLLLAGAHWSELQAHAQARLLSPRSLALAWLCFPFVKALHELGHALAVRRWNGEVHEFGIGLMLLVPAPYVDASASSRFTHRRERATVAAAGILVETGLAALALLFWLSVQPGLARDIAFIVLMIGSVSTLVFNANPLLRYDGYHVLCDAFDLHNLAPRSHAWWSAALRRHVLGAPADVPDSGRGERKWLVAYAPLSLAYRIGGSLTLVLWLGGKASLLGIASLAYVLIATLLLPLVRMARHALASAAPGGARTRVRLGLAMLTLAPGLLLFVAPMPLATIAPAVVWLPEQAQVRPEVEGVVTSVAARDGEVVHEGDLLIVLDNPQLLSAHERLASRLDGLRADHYRLLASDTGAAANLVQRIAAAEAELAQADTRIASLEVRAQVSGTLVMPHQGDLIGSFAKRGTTLGHVLAPSSLRVRAAVAQDDAELVRQRTRGAEVRLVDAPADRVRATVAQDMPAASTFLPSAALGNLGGGPYATDPKDEQGRRSLEPVFLVDLGVTGVPLERAGGRAWVRFDHGTETLAVQVARRATQLFLKHFDPTT